MDIATVRTDQMNITARRQPHQQQQHHRGSVSCFGTVVHLKVTLRSIYSWTGYAETLNIVSNLVDHVSLLWFDC
jgi:hypothetical protein